MASTQVSVHPGKLGQRVVRGALAYSGRQFAVMGLNVITGLALTRILFPADFGYAAMVGVVIGFALILSDGGLGVYLIQRQSEFTNADASRIISFQLLLYVILQAGLTIALLGGWLVYGNVTIWLLVWVAGFSMPFSLLRSASLILLERSLNFPKIAIIETGEQLAYAVVAIVLALMGAGVWSIVFASLVRPLLGWQLARRYAPWTLTMHYRPELHGDLRKGIRYGIIYQLPALLETTRAAINPLFIGTILGAASAGYVDRAILIAGLPMGILGTVWRKVLFPYFARVQTDLVITRRVFERSVYLHSVLDKAAYLPLIAFCPELVEIVVGPKWLPSVPLIYVFVFGNLLFVAFSTTSLALLPAMDKPGVLARISSVQVVAAWGLAIILVNWFGIIGYAFATLFLSVGTIYAYVHVRRLLGKFEAVLPIFKTLLAFGLSIALIRLIASWLNASSTSLMTIIALSLLGLILYFLILFVIDRQRMNATALSVYQSFQGT